MTETKKFIAMRETPELFKKYLDVVKRAEYLMCTVCLCDSGIELYVFNSDRTGIAYVEKYKEYDEDNLQKINTALDRRAELLKDEWLWSYEKLYESSSEGWSLDLTQKDYAVLEVGSTISQMQFYHVKWCFEDLRRTARFIADFVNPGPEALEEVQRQHEAFEEMKKRQGEA